MSNFPVPYMYLRVLLLFVVLIFVRVGKTREPLNLDIKSAIRQVEEQSQPRVLVMYGDADDFPLEVEKYFVPGADLDQPREGVIEIISQYDNDDFFLGGMEALLRAFGMSDDDAAKADGDDFGYTHGSHLTIGQTVNGKYFAILLISNLYTQKAPRNGDGLRPQYFTIHNMVGAYAKFPGEKFSVNMKNMSFTVGGGYETVNSEDPGGALNATSQQNYFHRFTDQITGFDTVRENIPSGIGKDYSLFLDLKMSVLKNIFLSQTKRVNLKGQVGLHITGVDGANYGEATVGLRRYKQKSPKSKASMVGAELGLREYETGATKLTASIFFRRGTEKKFWELRWDHPLIDEPVDFLNYDGDGETNMQIRFGRRFGRTSTNPIK